MKEAITRHLSKSFLAGIVAILPIAGLVLTVAYLEKSISSSGIAGLPFYFPGLGLILAVLIIYLIGLTVSTFVGKWLWSKFDKIMNNMPALGKLYISLKQILGYGKGEEAIFHETVLIKSLDKQSEEIGLITNKITLPDNQLKYVIFIPGAPNPTSGRLIIADPDQVQMIEADTNEVLKMLVAIGKTPINLDFKK